MAAIVTRESLQAMLNNENPAYVMHVVGRALVALYNRQTEGEKLTKSTNVDNNIGFTGGDAMGGSLTAMSYLKHKKLADWQVEKWTRRGKSGYSRLTKYHRQLNEVAKGKA